MMRPGTLPHFAIAIVIGVGTFALAGARWLWRRHRERQSVRAGILVAGIDRAELMRHELLLPRENVESEP